MSEVVGFLLIFALLIILLSINQAQFVPQQNNEIEFQHFQEVRNDMVQVRSDISEAGQADVSQYPTVTLGTQYPTRLFGVNPSPPAGTLQTSPTYNISIGDNNVSTRFLVSRNGYNEMNISPIWYEHSVLYLDAREDGGGIAIYEDQNIVTGNKTTRVTALQNEFSVSSTGRVTLDLEPAQNAEINASSLDGNITVKIPSRLDNSTYWDDAIDTSDSDALTYHGTESYPGESDIYWVNISVNLTANSDALKFNTVGIQEEPEDADSAKLNVGSGSGGGGGKPGEKDGGDSLEFVRFNKVKGGEIAFSINNTNDEPVTVTDVSLDLTEFGDYTGKKIKFSGSDNRKPDYDADGEFKELIDNNNKTSYAKIGAESESKVAFKTLKDGSNSLGELNLEETTSEDYDVAVEFRLKSGAEQTLYFKETT